MTYQRHDEIEAEITIGDVDVPVCIVYTAFMYADGSGASSVFIERIINTNTDFDITVSVDDRKKLAEWIRGKQG